MKSGALIIWLHVLIIHLDKTEKSNFDGEIMNICKRFVIKTLLSYGALKH
jgi:hypothetical protein